jgi:hypothetical protein
VNTAVKPDRVSMFEAAEIDGPAFQAPRAAEYGQQHTWPTMALCLFGSWHSSLCWLFGVVEFPPGQYKSDR